MTSFFSRLFKRKSDAGDGAESFAARFLRFRLFLSAYIEAYGEMMDFEERLADERPFGMPFLRVCTARLTVTSMQCVMQLNALGNGGFERLNAPFAVLRSEVQDILARGVTPLSGPLALPYDAVDEEHENIVAPGLAKLKAIRLAHPEFMPRGFVVTGAAWWSYFNNPDMHDEIDRIMLISQDDPGSYSEAAATIRERLTASFPLPPELEAAVRARLQTLAPELSQPDHALLVRCIPVRTEHGALTIPEQVLRTPLEPDAVLAALRSSLTMAYRPRAMIYRLKRGIRDRAMPFCVALTLLPEKHARGSVHRKLETLNPDALCVHVRRGFSAPDALPAQASVEGASLPDPVREKVEQSAWAALENLSDAPVRGNRHEIFWAASERGDFYVLGVNALPDPKPEEPLMDPARTSGQEFRLAGGFSTYPGVARGPAFPVRNFSDALLFPIGDILLLQQATPRWSFLLDFAAGAVAGDGTGNGLFARTARRYGRPTILRQPEAFERIEQGQPLCLMASADHSPLICRENEEEGLNAPEPAALPPGVPGAAYPLESADSAGRDAPLWLPTGDLAVMARDLAPKVVSLTLPDSDDVDFRAENCQTFHDFLAYCHVHAVREMFRAGSARKSAQAPAKQLICEVPKQFWIINLDDGFYGTVAGPVVKLEEIASLPMRALWEGFTDKPWDGPPALNAKGFLSVLFEASANPSLDPASQSTQYTEKNVFLIARRFCSMRCRFGFHFLAMDCLLGEREKERFIIFQFKGGAANLQRRIRRVHFVAELLSQFDFATEITGDTLTARLESGGEEKFLGALRVLGYLTMHTRQLDMIMGDEQALAAHRFQMLEDMLALAARPFVRLS